MKDAEWILLRFGELTLKGRNRHVFENRVINHLRAALKSYSRVKLTRTYGRLYLELNGEPYEEVAQRLEKIFGLNSFSPVRKCGKDLAEIRNVALQVIRDQKRMPQTFKVSVRRTDKQFPHTSAEMNHLIGGFVLHNTPGLKVDVHQPGVELRVEIRSEGVFIYSDHVPGLGGYPLGSSGKAMLMLSGGIDSPVAGWLAMRKGLKIEAVHFHSYPYTSERAQQKVIDLTKKLTVYGGRLHLHMVPFTEIQTKLNQARTDHLMITLMRRTMFRITQMLAEKSEAGAIVTGESLGQVASQTLSSLNAIGRVVSLPVLRPLITMDKNEIIRIAEKIDTFPISILPYEDCCTLFLPKSPSTNPNLNVTEKIESRFDWLQEAMADAVNQTETLIIHADEVDVDKHLF